MGTVLIQEAVDPALRDRPDLGQSDRKEVGRQSERRTVEVPAGLDPPVREDHRVVYSRLEFPLGDSRDEVQSNRGRRR